MRPCAAKAPSRPAPQQTFRSGSSQARRKPVRPAQRAEKIPGEPSSESTANPESSANAAVALNCGGDRIDHAFGWENVSPDRRLAKAKLRPHRIASTQCGASKSRIWASVPRTVWFAITRWPVIRLMWRHPELCRQGRAVRQSTIIRKEVVDDPGQGPA